MFGLGGGQGTWLAATVMRELPLGLPKVLVTTIVGRAPLHVGASDIIMIPSITDIAGLNRILTPGPDPRRRRDRRHGAASRRPVDRRVDPMHRPIRRPTGRSSP